MSNLVTEDRAILAQISSFSCMYACILAVLGLYCCAWAFCSCSEWRLLSIYGAWAPHCSGFSCCGAQVLGTQSQLPQGMWDLPRPGIEPTFPTLAGGFLTTGPPGKCPYLLMHLPLANLSGKIKNH